MPSKKSVSFKRRTRRYKGRVAKKYVKAAGKIQAAFRGFRKRAQLKAIKIKSNGINSSFDHNYNKRSRFGMKMAHKYDTEALNVAKNQYAAIITLTAGFQAYTELSMWSVNQLTNRILGAAGQAPGIAGSLVNTARTFLTKCVSETAFTNTTSANVELDLYLFNCKRDGSNVSSLWTSGMYDESAQLATDWTTAGYGVTPFDSKAVGQFWKCYKVIHIFLAPGQSHIHRDTIHLDKMLNNEILEATPAACLAGYTKSMLCVVKGMPVTSSVNGGLVTTSNGKVDFVRVETYEFKYVLDNDTNFRYTYNNVLSATPGQVYNQGAGTVGAVIST